MSLGRIDVYWYAWDRPNTIPGFSDSPFSINGVVFNHAIVSEIESEHSGGNVASPVRNPYPSISQKQLEDPLEYLPCSTILEYQKGQLIYGQEEAATNLFLVVAGRVKVSRV